MNSITNEGLPRQVEDNRQKIIALEQKFDVYEKEIIHDSYRIKEMIVTAVAEGVAPAMAEQRQLAERIHALEDAPRDAVFNFMKYTVGVMGTILVALAIAFFKIQFNL